MKIFLAGLSSKSEEFYRYAGFPKFFLESFFYFQNIRWLIPLIKNNPDFMLDSGAFTFMNKPMKGGGRINWEGYTRSYAEFVNKAQVQLFYEMDIDSIVGLDRVEKLRKILESETGRKPIPVWHKNRGMDYFTDMCRAYPYVAIGGIVKKEITPDQHGILNWFCDKAHSLGSKIHSLGFSPKNIHLFRFDSCDSTSWLSGGKFGHLFKFNGHEMVNIQNRDKRRKHRVMFDVHNLREWIRYQKYAHEKIKLPEEIVSHAS